MISFKKGVHFNEEKTNNPQNNKFIISSIHAYKPIGYNINKG